ncbi:unnamed protein product [Darwinula stevensoni]|uniref:Protein quiver n=1 Tax=Darwinula stevensoni TaxID=69355 RepID=A0A7R8X0F0_9CRUS|nr:unnamed protein product [Darwinula stevensoni]CAG0879091.1 unnamed protein product [Darwinula stevensoni]
MLTYDRSWIFRPSSAAAAASTSRFDTMKFFAFFNLLILFGVGRALRCFDCSDEYHCQWTSTQTECKLPPDTVFKPSFEWYCGTVRDEKGKGKLLEAGCFPWHTKECLDSEDEVEMGVTDPMANDLELCLCDTDLCNDGWELSPSQLLVLFLLLVSFKHLHFS